MRFIWLQRRTGPILPVRDVSERGGFARLTLALFDGPQRCGTSGTVFHGSRGRFPYFNRPKLVLDCVDNCLLVRRLRHLFHYAESVQLPLAFGHAISCGHIVYSAGHWKNRDQLSPFTPSRVCSKLLT